MTQEIKTRVPFFANIEAVKAAQLAKKEQREADLYPRDGSKELFRLERSIAEMLRVNPGNLLLYNTGMSAVVDALEVTRPTVGTKILRGTQHYSQAGNYITDELRSRQVSVLQTEPNSMADISAALISRRPDIVFFETVTNGSEMAVLDIEKFLRLQVLQDLNPVIILDNTLPSSTAVPLGAIMAASDRRIIGIESGTKYIGLNGEMCGIAYTYNSDLLLGLRKRRQRTGSLLSVSAVETIRDYMPKTAEDYHQRNGIIFRHTLRLAKACSDSPINGKEYIITHPNLPPHVDHQTADAYSVNGVTPVFFIQPMTFEEGHYKIAESLWQNPVISSLCELGQSFGFDRSRIWPDDSSATLRISGGIYSEAEQAELDKAFYEALSNYE